MLKLFKRQTPLVKLHKWAEEHETRVQVGNAVDPATSKYIVVIALPDLFYDHPVLGVTYLTADGKNADEAAKAMFAKIEQTTFIKPEQERA